MKKSINLWAFPYPAKMTLRQCLELAKKAGFDGIELNYDLDSDLSPKATTQDFIKIRKMAEEIGIAISGLCSFLFWPYPLTSNNPDERARGLELAEKMTQRHMISEPRTCWWFRVRCICLASRPRSDSQRCLRSTCQSGDRETATQSEQLGVYLNIENIFFNGYLLSPMEMVQFVDHFKSDHVRAHFDTGNIMMFQFPSIGFRFLVSGLRMCTLRSSPRREPISR